MKTRTIVLLFAAICSSCKQSVPVATELPTFSGVSFSVGNQYNIQHMQGSIPGGVADWYQITTIVSDTIIGQERFYLFSSGELLRSAVDSVVRWDGASQVCWYRFNVESGHMVLFQNYQLTVSSVSVDSVFGEQQKVIEVSNSATAVDTVLFAKYSTKFGVLLVQKTLSSKIWRTSLTGAKLDTTSYGFM
ncbi:MAG: hypothetical protein HYY49_01555 [Ignavibacteriales bacterium]|nr:hypothetical protein [Ignavibacteriales bacterium]